MDKENKSLLLQASEQKIFATFKNRHTSSVLYSGTLIFIICIVGLFLVTLYTSLQAPKNFPAGSSIEYKKDDYVSNLGVQLKEKKYIRSVYAFKFFIYLYGSDKKIVTGKYYFDSRLPVNVIAHRFVLGDFNQKTIRMTVPEGSTVSDIADIVSKKIKSIDSAKFKSLAKQKEGFLFPDTYFIDADVTEEEIIKKMEETYASKVLPLIQNIKANKKQENQIIILASLLEEEGKTEVDKKMIAGILLNRLEKDMPLQVDATINYIKGETSKVYFSDLEIVSPYNTYKNKGLPPGPISNPGLQSIQSALTPTKSNYLYYLTGNDGIFHYAKTFEEHVRNKERYLN